MDLLLQHVSKRLAVVVLLTIMPALAVAQVSVTVTVHAVPATHVYCVAFRCRACVRGCWGRRRLKAHTAMTPPTTLSCCYA